MSNLQFCYNCPRCNKNHDNMKFFSVMDNKSNIYNNKSLSFEAWTICPETYKVVYARGAQLW